MMSGSQRGNRFIVISSLHKEIRRGDLARALSWAWIYLSRNSAASLSKYLFKIHFEETRSTSLWQDLLTNKEDIHSHLCKLTLVFKKWHLKKLKPHVINWHSGYKGFCKNSRITPIELAGRIQNLDSLVDGYELYFHLKENKNLRQLAQDIIANEFLNRNLASPEISKYLKYSYEFMNAFEILALGYSDQSEKHLVSSQCTELFIPQVQNYCHDVHTWAGVHALNRNWSACLKAKAFQSEVVDLRFSGMIVGLLFREKATELSDDIRHINWKDVEISNVELAAALELDKYFYPRFFKRIGRL